MSARDQMHEARLQTSLDAAGDALERAMIEATVHGFDRRAAALRADTSGDAATRSHRAWMADFLENCAHDVAALLGPMVPAQGRLALAPPEGSR